MAAGGGATQAAPRDAATVVVLRDTAAGSEVLLMRRHARAAFMGGLSVFPGGKVDAADASPELLAQLSEEVRQETRRIAPTPGRELSADAALAFVVTALRELFEEACVLLAARPDGTRPAARELEQWRQRMARGEVGFAQVLAGLGARLGAERLLYWAHWITPSAEPRRYDTRFFLARLPAATEARADEREAVELFWLAPRDAVAAHHEGTLTLAPPTLWTLEELSAVADFDGLWRMPPRVDGPILPKLVERALLLPWDAQYESAPGEGVAVSVERRGWHPQRHSRVVLEGQRWRSR